MPLSLFSPAKINLFLRILGKRPDGYHELASLFQTIDFGDTLTFAFSKEDSLTCSDPTLPCDGTNLIAKAIDLFRRKTGFSFSLSVHLEKNIPTQAGLGGGSSNAATTLWALNSLHYKPFSEHELQTWSSEIGSDIPFFFSQGSAYCTGRGEIVRNLEPPQMGQFSIAKPPVGLSTPAIYKALKLEECSSRDPEELLAGFYSGTPEFINDLEIPALRLSPSLAIFKNELLQEGHPVFMTGSGSAFIRFGFGPTKPLTRSPNSWFTL